MSVFLAFLTLDASPFAEPYRLTPAPAAPRTEEPAFSADLALFPALLFATLLAFDRTLFAVFVLANFFPVLVEPTALARSLVLLIALFKLPCRAFAAVILPLKPFAFFRFLTPDTTFLYELTVPTPFDAMDRALSALLSPLDTFFPALLFAALVILLVTLFPALEFRAFFPSLVEATCLPSAFVLDAALFRLADSAEAALILLPRPFAFLRLEKEFLTPTIEEAADTALSAVLKVDFAAFPAFDFASFDVFELTVFPSLELTTLEPAFVLDSDFPSEPTLDAVDFRLLMTEEAALILPEAPFADLNDEMEDFRFFALE